LLALLPSLLGACDVPERERGEGGGGSPDLSQPQTPPPDLGGAFDPDAACAVATQTAQVEKLPVDIIWVIDNSSSMSPAISAVQSGLNSFASLVDGKMLDYRIVMLSLRNKTNAVQVGGDDRYAICIPPPLSSGNNCDNGPRFFHSSIDVRSVQPLEQLLGTLGQTTGYQMGDEKGGEPWKQFLRPNSTKTIVVVTDDNARFSPTQFETFAGGKNPYNNNQLPPGLLDPSWNGLFTDYTFSGIYGWDSIIDPTQKCTFTNGTQPASPGQTYTSLVQKTKGVRAKICDSAASWTTFFDQVAQAVAKASKISCDMVIPQPASGALDPNLVNVTVSTPSGSTTLYKVSDLLACGTKGGWYYDDNLNPTRVLLCPNTCSATQSQIAMSSMTEVRIHFGCASVIP
jgi:hypothetical protein